MPSAAKAGATAAWPHQKPRFSAAVKAGFRASRWPRKARRRRWRSGSSSTGAPAQRSSPSAGRSSPAIRRSRLDLPLPLGPAQQEHAAGGEVEIEMTEDKPLAAPAEELAAGEGAGAKSSVMDKPATTMG